MIFKPDWSSLKIHRDVFTKEFRPSWHHDAKIGVIIHWGIYSVPGWAPPLGELSYIPEIYGWNFWFKYNPYAEWYYNSFRITGSVVSIYHELKYGVHTSYEDFVKIFEEEASKWKASEWVNLFVRSGIKYVVFVTKHHDGYLMWPSEIKNPKKQNWYSTKDFVGELASVCRANGLRFATYYSSGIDWTFNNTVIVDIESLKNAQKFDEVYREYIKKHWYELIEKYKPDMLWNDMGYPFEDDVLELFAYYYNTIEDGLINDRFTSKHYDFTTPEYKIIQKISEEKWEAVRGLGYSFGYNRAEEIKHSLTFEKLLTLLIDIISKNGNLLIGITPQADGTIPLHQAKVILKLGSWLSINGKAIYGTRPWIIAEGIGIGFRDGIPLRFARKENKLYVYILSKPRSRKLLLKPFEGVLKLKSNTYIEIIGEESIEWSQTSNGIEIKIPKYLSPQPVYVIEIEPVPDLEK